MTIIKIASPAAGMIEYRKMDEIDYNSLDFDPYESVKKPDGMEEHLEQLAMLHLLRAYFVDYDNRADVFWDYNSNICYDRNDLTRHISPDVYVAFGVDAAAIRSRLIYLPWEAGKPPDFVMEIATLSTWREDMEIKPAIYETVGAREYWTFDPTGGRYCGVPLIGRSLANGKYRNIELTSEPDGVLKGYSDVLGASVAWNGGEPRLYDRASGQYLESHKEIAAARTRAEAARRIAETQRDAMAAQLDITETQLAAEVRARIAAERGREAEARARAAEQSAAQEEISRLRELIRRIRNR